MLHLGMIQSTIAPNDISGDCFGLSAVKFSSEMRLVTSSRAPTRAAYPIALISVEYIPFLDAAFLCAVLDKKIESVH